MGIIHLVRTQNVPKNSFLPPDIHKRVRISGGGVGWEGEDVHTEWQKGEERGKVGEEGTATEDEVKRGEGKVALICTYVRIGGRTWQGRE